MRNISLAALVVLASSNAFALESDRDQQMNVDANYMKSVTGERDNADKPSVDQLDGNVLVAQGSMKARGDHATIYRNAAGVADANGRKGALTRVVLTGKQAYMEQVHDGDCMLITSNANTIDFHNDTNTAILTGNVVVNQKGKGEFRGEHMVYNTKTGEMESGSTTPEAGAPRVHLTLEPKTDAPAATNTNNCGFPLGNHVPKADKKPAGKSS
ncbi:MAG TPA: lipopolysaccharide transport periplasmic protein LptA [Rudaea sp.]